MSRKKTNWRRRSSPKGAAGEFLKKKEVQMFWVSLVYRVWRAGDSLEKPDISVESVESVHQDGLIWQLTSSRTSLGRLETEQVLTAEGAASAIIIVRFCLFWFSYLLLAWSPLTNLRGFASTCSSGGFALDKLELLFLNTCSIRCISVGQKSNNSNA